jgi:hypothetical protein
MAATKQIGIKALPRLTIEKRRTLPMLGPASPMNWSQAVELLERSY